MTTPELSRAVRIDSLGGEARSMAIAAKRSEREALARRFGLIAIKSLAAEVELSRKGSDVRLSGRIEAAVVQACSASGEPVEGRIGEPFELLFRPANISASAGEFELGAGELDLLPYEGGAIDVGEAIAETLSLALDPFPRGPSADEALRKAGVLSEQQTAPFAALAALKDKEAKSRKR
ncbi:MAG: YceD family protein [Sphingosinicella sp.]